MSELIPAIIPKDYNDLDDKMNLVAGRVPLVHIDVMDGTLTKTVSWPFDSAQGKPDEMWEKIVNEEEGLPAWEELNFEVHLMVKDPMAVVDSWVRAGAERVTIHFEAFDDTTELDLALRDLRNRFSMSRLVETEVGLAVNLDTPVEAIFPHVLEADFIHLMSIDHDGEQGVKFEEEIFEKISNLRDEFPDTIISVDGGVSEENIPRLLDAGVNRLIVGSAIYGKDSPEDALDDLLNIVYDHGTFN